MNAVISSEKIGRKPCFTIGNGNGGMIAEAKVWHSTADKLVVTGVIGFENKGSTLSPLMESDLFGPPDVIHSVRGFTNLLCEENRRFLPETVTNKLPDSFRGKGDLPLFCAEVYNDQAVFWLYNSTADHTHGYSDPVVPVKIPFTPNGFCGVLTFVYGNNHYELYALGNGCAIIKLHHSKKANIIAFVTEKELRILNP